MAAAAGQSAESLAARDVVGGDLIDVMGIREALGTSASDVLAAVESSASAAAAKLPTAEELGASIGRSRPRLAGANRQLFALMQILHPAMLDQLTGTTTKPGDTNTDSRTEHGNSTTSGANSTSTVVQTTRASVTGARVEVSIQMIEHDVVTDPATGATLLDRTDDRTIVADLTACPDTAGAADGTVHTIVTNNTKTGAGPGGGVHMVGHVDTLSKFHGPVNDAAVLQTVSQDFERTADWTTTAADGSDQSGTLDVGYDGLTTQPAASGELTVGSLSTSKSVGHGTVTGDALQSMIADSIGGAAIDIVTISPSYKMAQHLWQNGRCVIVVAPDYNVETPVDIGKQKSSQHTEKVEKGSTTRFGVKLRHRFEGGVNAEMKTELSSGEKSLDPKSLPSGAGKLAYVAGDENGKDAIATLTSTSKRGIGKLLLTFHTETKQVQVDISGTQLFDGIIPLKVKVATVVLKKQPDDTFAGSATASVTGSFDVCDPIMTETGTIDLIATQAVAADGTPGDWTITSAPKPTGGQVTFHCPTVPDLGAFGFPAGGVSYSFVHDIGPMKVEATGGSLTVHVAAAMWGPLDATINVKVITD